MRFRSAREIWLELERLLYCRVYFMNEKSEVSSKLEEILVEARTSGITVKELLTTDLNLTMIKLRIFCGNMESGG